MIDELEGLVSEAFAAEAELTRQVPDLAVRARQSLRRRRRVRATIGAVAAVLVASTVSVGVAYRHNGEPTQRTQRTEPIGPVAEVSSTTDLMPLVVAARLDASLQLGDGALRLDPATAPPGMRETDAVRLWATGNGLGQTLTGDTVVFLADATVRLPVARPQVPDLSAWGIPRFTHRTVWAIATTAGLSNCPAQASSVAVAGPQPQLASVMLIAVDGSGQGVTYSTGVSNCFPRRPPSAEVASYAVSVHSSVTASTPPCGSVDGTITSSDRTGVTSSTTGVQVWMLGERCEGSMSVATLLRRPAGAAQDGLELGRRSLNLSSGLEYFDGQLRLFPS